MPGTEKKKAKDRARMQAKRQRDTEVTRTLYEALDELYAHARFVGIAPHYEDMARSALRKYLEGK